MSDLVNRHPFREPSDPEVRYVFKRDLPAVADGSFLFCPECCEEFSGTPGDYFWKSEDEPFVCDDCEQEPLRLVKRVSRLVVVAGEEMDW